MIEKKPETVVWEILEASSRAANEVITVILITLIRSAVTVANHIQIYGDQVLSSKNLSSKGLEIEYDDSSMRSISTKK